MSALPLTPEQLRTAAVATENALPPGHGFLLITIPFTDDPAKAIAQYTASIDRETAVKILKACLFRWGHDEQWMKNAK